jgi:hypothetical protein
VYNIRVFFPSIAGAFRGLLPKEKFLKIIEFSQKLFFFLLLLQIYRVIFPPKLRAGLLPPSSEKKTLNIEA